MSSKEVVTVTVLINTGLLLILFATGVDLSEKGSSPQANAVTTIASVVENTQGDLQKVTVLEASAPTSTPIAAPLVLDEVDQVLQAWSQPQALPVETSAVASDTSLPASVADVDVVEVTVKKGDFLERIAKAYGVSVGEIMDLNHMSSAKLKIGQVLKVPNRAGVTTPSKAPKQKETSKATPAVTKTASVKPEYYTVKEGDNPWTIANKNHIKVNELLKLNSLDEAAARKIKPGDKLRVK